MTASLLHGWLPVAGQLVAGVALLTALSWRTSSWRRRWLPVSVATGIAVAGLAYWYDARQGLSGGEPSPASLWIWLGLTGLAAAVAAVGWRGSTWWLRGTALVAVPLCALSALLALNLWTGYFDTTSDAYAQLTGRRLPQQSDRATVTALQKQGAVPRTGSVVPIRIENAASGFAARDEMVYLPPVWFASYPPPRLPAVVMLPGVLSTAQDWLRHGHASQALDDFAAAHAGNAPVVVFADPSAAFNNDTECVNGPRGNAADHLVKDVPPYLISHFGASPDPANWAVAGFSMGGTCAVDLAVMHPDVFSTFDDISGDVGPNVGSKQQTIDQLYGGDGDAWARFDPATVLLHHGPYQGFAGRFDVDDGAPDSLPDGAPAADVAAADPPPPGDHLAAAQRLCGLGRLDRVNCSIIGHAGGHDWPFARTAFAAALPWLAGRIGTPGALPVPEPADGEVTVPAYQRST